MPPREGGRVCLRCSHMVVFSRQRVTVKLWKRCSVELVQVRIRMRTVGSCNTVRVSGSFSLLNAVVSAIYFSSAYCTGAVIRCFVACSARIVIQTDRPSTVTLTAHARRGLIMTWHVSRCVEKKTIQLSSTLLQI